MEFSQFNVNTLMDITSRPDLVFVSGKGSWLEDHAGKRYLDWQLDDPSELDLDGVRRVRDDIRIRVEHLISELAPS